MCGWRERDAGGVRAGAEGDEAGVAGPSGAARVRPVRQQPRRHGGHEGDPVRALQPPELPRRRRAPALLPGDDNWRTLFSAYQAIITVTLIHHSGHRMAVR